MDVAIAALSQRVNRLRNSAWTQHVYLSLEGPHGRHVGDPHISRFFVESLLVLRSLRSFFPL